MRGTPLTLLFAGALAGCGSDTGSERTHFQLTIEGTGGTGKINEHGWAVTLTEAKLHLAPVQFFEGAPLFSQIDRRPIGRRVWDELFALRSAEAHPGHYMEGEALADFLTPSTVDLLGDVVNLGEGDGVTGAYNSAEIALSPTAELGGASATVEGRAVKDGVTIELDATLVDAIKVKGIAFGTDVTATSGKIAIAVDLDAWLARADFSMSAGGTLEPGTQPHNAFSRGVNNTSAFSFTWSPR